MHRHATRGARAGVPRDGGRVAGRARAVVEQFERAVDERYSLHAQVLATKRDVAEMETRLAREIASGKVDRVKWVVAALTAQTALRLGASKLL